MTETLKRRCGRRWCKIVLGLTPKAIRLAVLICLASVVAQNNAVPTNRTASVTLAWDPSPEPDVTEYRIYVGTNSASYFRWNTIQAPITTNTVINLQPGMTYYFVATALNTVGLESLPSNEVSYRVPIPTISPTNLVFIKTNHFWRVTVTVEEQ